MTYLGKEIDQYSLSELETIWLGLNDALAKREEASKHPKFDKSTNKKAMEFPSPNPEFLKLKEAIELEIERKKK